MTAGSASGSLKSAAVRRPSEFADILEKNILTETLGIATLRRTDHLLRTIYAGNFHTLTDKIDEMEKTLAKENA